MATIPAPRTWVNGDVVTAEQFNANIRDVYDFMCNRPLCQVQDSGGQTTVNWDNGEAGDGAELYTWDTLEFDNDGIYSSGANSRLTCRTAGLYEIVLHVYWEILNDTNAGNRFATIQKNNNGGVVLHSATEIATDMQYCLVSDSAVPQTNHISIAHALSVGDYVEAVVFNSLPSDVDTTGSYMSYFSMRWIGRD